MKAKPAAAEIRAQALKGFECWNGGAIDAMQDMYAPDARLDFSAFVDGGVRFGRDELLRFWREMWEAWEGIRLDPLDVLEIDPRRYVVPTRLWGKGRRSGIEVDQSFAFVYTIREDNLIIRTEVFSDIESALAAAGAES